MMMISRINKILILTIAVFVVGCATGGKRKKNSKEAEVYLKGVQSKIVDATKSEKRADCEVMTNIKEEKWAVIVNKANGCVQAENYRQVERYGNYLAKKHHMGPWGAYFLSISAENSGDVDRAVWMIDLALKKAPSEGLLIYQKARLAWNRQEHEHSAELFEDAIKTRPDLLGARLMLGQLYYRDQEFSKAKKHFKAALDMDSKQIDAWVGLAECELEDGNGEAALNALEKAIDLAPKNFDYRMREAHVYERVTKQPKKALTAYRRIQKMGRTLKLNQSVTNTLNEKIQQLTLELAKQKPGEQISSRTPANEEGVSK